MNVLGVETCKSKSASGPPAFELTLNRSTTCPHSVSVTPPCTHKPIAKLLGRAPRIQRSVQNECVPHKHRCPAPFFFHLHAVSKPFYANRPSLVNRNVTMRDRFRYFNAMVPLVACLGCRLLRSIVGPLGDVDWTLAWHELFIIGRSGICDNSSWLENTVGRMLGRIS